MSEAAERAYALAEEEIERAKQEGATRLSFNRPDARALDRLPSGISALTELQTLSLNKTRVADITTLAALSGLRNLGLSNTRVADIGPLAALSGLRSLDLNGTPLADIGPLAALTELRELSLLGTQVADLRPLRDLAHLGDAHIPGFEFIPSPAATLDARLAALGELFPPKKRADEVRAYLRTLPPWPEPYTPAARPDGTPPQPIGRPPPPRPPLRSRVADRQIALLLGNPIATQVNAENLAQQIRSSLRDVPATDANRMEPPFEAMAAIAEALEGIARQNELREDALRREVASLEAQVTALTELFRDEAVKRATAEALVSKSGFFSEYRKKLAATGAVATFAVAGIGLHMAGHYFLGAENPVMQAFNAALGRTPPPAP